MQQALTATLNQDQIIDLLGTFLERGLGPSWNGVTFRPPEYSQNGEKTDNQIPQFSDELHYLSGKMYSTEE